MPNRTEIILDGKDKTGKAFSSVGSNFVKLENKAGGFAGKMKSMIGGVSSNLTALAGVAGVSLALIGYQFSEAVDKFAEFDTGLRNVNTIVNVSEAELGGLSDGLLKLKKDLGIVETTELTDGLYQAVSAGVDAGDSLQFMGVAAKAAKAGISDTATSVDGITTVINAFQKETSEAEAVADIMFQTVKLGKTNFEELAASINQVAPLAASMDVEFEQVSGGLATLTKQGVPTAQAVTQIRAAMISTNAILGDGWGKSMSLQEAFQKVAEQAGGSQNKLKEMMGRIEGVNAVLAMTGTNSNMAAEDLAAMMESHGAMTAAFEEQSESFQMKMDKVTATFDVIKIQIIEDLIPAIELGLGALEDLAAAIHWTMGEAQKEWRKVIEEARGGQNVVEGWRQAFEGYDKSSLTSELGIINKEIEDLKNQKSLGGLFAWMGFDNDSNDEAIGKIAELKSQYAAIKLLLNPVVTNAGTDKVDGLNNGLNETKTLTEEEIKAAERLAAQWAGIDSTLANEIAQKSLPKVIYEFGKIEQKVASLTEKFGNNDIITQWADTMKSALLEIDTSNIATKGPIDLLGGTTPQSLEPLDTTQIDAMHEYQMQASTELTEFELTQFALRQAASGGMFQNMSDAAYNFYQASGQQSKAAFAVYKGFAIAEAGIKTYESAVSAFNAFAGIPLVGPALGYAAAAAAVTFGLSNIARIASMQPGNQPSGSVGGGGTPSIPTSTTNYSDASTTNSNNNSGNKIEIHVHGNVMDADELARTLAPSLEKALGDGVGNSVINIG